MRFLLDATFLDGASGPQPGGHHIDVYRGVLGDVALVQHAASSGYGCVIFLGSDLLAQADIARDARRAGVIVAATSTEDPIEAELAVRSNLAPLSGRLPADGPYVIRKTSILAVTDN